MAGMIKMAGSYGQRRVRTTPKENPLLTKIHHLSHQSNMQKVATALGASGPNLLQPHFVSSPLCSASLLASSIRHKLVRNLEHLSTPLIKRALDWSSERVPDWNHETEQETRKQQCRQVLAYLEEKKQRLELRLKYYMEGTRRYSELQHELDTINAHISRLSIMQDYIKDVVKGSLHPSSLQSDDRVFLTPAEAAQLPSPSATIRGVLIRIKGPRRGNRAWKWEKSAGRISINSVKYVVAEEYKTQIPSKNGTFGLTVRIVYCRRNRLIDSRQKLNVIDRSPNFTFLEDPLFHKSTAPLTITE